MWAQRKGKSDTPEMRATSYQKLCGGGRAKEGLKVIIREKKMGGQWKRKREKERG